MLESSQHMDEDEGDNNFCQDTMDIFKLLMKFMIKAEDIRKGKQAKERYVAKACIGRNKASYRDGDDHDQ